MKRDMDLIRSILLLVEEQPAGELVRDLSALGDDYPTIVEHIRLAEESGLLEAIYGGGGRAAMVKRLTSSGHDFLDQARESTRWTAAKQAVAKAGAGATVEVFKTVLAHLTTVTITAALPR